MTDKKLTLYAWGGGTVVINAVQGENKSREIRLTLIERRAGENTPWVADAVDKRLDLSDMATPRLYVTKPDGTSVFTDGKIVNATNGEVSFCLSAQLLSVPGTATCQVVLSNSDGEILKITGLLLKVERSNLDGAIESTDNFESVVVVLDKANAAAERAEAAAQTAEGVAKEVKTAYDSGKFVGPQGPPGSVGLGNCNIVVDSNRSISSAAYAMGTFAVTRLTAGARYTVVACFDAPPGQSLLVAASNGSTMANLSTPTTGNIYVTRGARAPSSNVAPELRIYNYPQGASSALTLYWMCVYSGDLSDPPLYWTPSVSEVLNANVSITAKDIAFPGGETLEDVLQEGGLLPAPEKGIWTPSITLSNGYLAEFERASYQRNSNSTVTVQLYMRFTRKMTGQTTVLTINGLPFACTAKTKGAAIQGWKRTTEPKELYPVVNSGGSALNITTQIGSVDVPAQAQQLEDAQSWAYITITYPI